jgi:hypothetical protein
MQFQCGDLKVQEWFVNVHWINKRTIYKVNLYDVKNFCILFTAKSDPEVERNIKIYVLEYIVSLSYIS